MCGWGAARGGAISVVAIPAPQVMRVWVDVRAGVEHLAGMVAPLPLPPGHVPVPISEETIVDVLAQVSGHLTNL